MRVNGDRAEGAGGHAGTAGGANLRLLVELVLRQTANGARPYTARELAAEVGSASGMAVGDVITVLEAVLTGAGDVIPNELVAPLAALFDVPTTDLTADPAVAETAILGRLLAQRGAAGVLFCRDHLDRPVANRLLRAVLGAIRGEQRSSPPGVGGSPP